MLKSRPILEHNYNMGNMGAVQLGLNRLCVQFCYVLVNSCIHLDEFLIGHLVFVIFYEKNLQKITNNQI